MKNIPLKSLYPGVMPEQQCPSSLMIEKSLVLVQQTPAAGLRSCNFLFAKHPKSSNISQPCSKSSLLQSRQEPLTWSKSLSCSVQLASWHWKIGSICCPFISLKEEEAWKRATSRWPSWIFGVSPFWGLSCVIRSFISAVRASGLRLKQQLYMCVTMQLSYWASKVVYTRGQNGKCCYPRWS